jgi:hypothetical protein
MEDLGKVVEIELKNRRIPLNRFLSSDFIISDDVKNMFRIKDNIIASAICKEITGNNNVEDLRLEIDKENNQIINDLQYLNATEE